jgi:hypothetical protein
MLFIAIWLISFALTFGLSFAYFQRKFQTISDTMYKEDFCFCFTLAIFFGPSVLVGFLIFYLFNHEGKFYGFKFF